MVVEYSSFQRHVFRHIIVEAADVAIFDGVGNGWRRARGREGRGQRKAREGVYKEGNVYIYVRLATDQATEFEKTKPLLEKQGDSRYSNWITAWHVPIFRAPTKVEIQKFPSKSTPVKTRFNISTFEGAGLDFHLSRKCLI